MSGYATCGLALALPEGRVVSAPRPGPHPRKARLPGLVSDLGRAALAGRELPGDARVLFGTGLGSLTETEAFVVQMLEAEEAAPKPRAFSSSVHNAAAGQLAQAVGARGESQTFVHGALSFPWAAWHASRRAGPALVGAADERTARVDVALATCPAPSGAAGEGGAVFLLGAPDATPLARLAGVAFGRGEPAAWLAGRADRPPIVFAPCALPGTIRYDAWTGVLDAAPAQASAAAVALLCGELSPAALGLSARPDRVGVLAVTRWGELGIVVWAAP